MRDIRDALADPLAMLALVSTLLAVVDPRSADPFARAPERSREQPHDAAWCVRDRDPSVAR